jgi:hypothetical protein
MLTAHDVIYLVGRIRIVLVQEAVFTAISRAPGHEARNSALISAGNLQSESGLGPGHDQNMLNLHKVVQLGSSSADSVPSR